MDPIRVLITGGCGFLGTSIISALLSSKRYAITAIDINPPSLGSSTFTADVRYVRCDVLDVSSLQKVFAEARPAIVIHTVGVYPLGAKRYSMKGKEVVFKVNIEGTRNVLEASKECGAKGLVYTSSVTVVLDKMDRDFRNVDERWGAGDVDTSYGLSKVCRSNPFYRNRICLPDFLRLIVAAAFHHFTAISAACLALQHPLTTSSSKRYHTYTKLRSRL
jgi:sterol-4alpha-carboxylate 3-dehydrogenase (decarboxylating)